MFGDAGRLVSAALPERRSRVVLLLLLGAVAAAAEGAGLMLLASLINQLPAGAADAGLRLELVMLGYLGVAAAAAASGWARTLYGTRLRIETADRLRRDALEAILNASWPALRRMPGPATTQMIVSEAGRVGTGIDFLMSAAAIAIRLPVLALVAFRLSVPLAAIVFAISALVTVLTTRADRRARATGERMLKAGRVLQTSLAETFAGRRVIKVFGLERERLDTFGDAVDQSRAAYLAQQRVFAGSTAGIAFAVPVASAVMLWIAVRVMGMPIGSALVFALALARFGQSVLAFRSARRIVLAALPAEAAVRALIDDARAEAEPAPARELVPPARHIALAHVSLTYEDGTVALSDVSAEIPAGRITVLTGASGAGKSSLADIVMGLAAPTAGIIALDERTLEAGDRRAWRAHVGYVPQDAFLFNTSIRDNLRASNVAASDADLWRALEDAGAAGVVRALPAGLDTIAGERGSRLSAGQAQRIALARALLRHPALLVLDEPTSALDAEGEAHIARTIMRLKGRHTIVLIAHRPALAAIADHTIALENGRVV